VKRFEVEPWNPIVATGWRGLVGAVRATTVLVLLQLPVCRRAFEPR